MLKRLTRPTSHEAPVCRSISRCEPNPVFDVVYVDMFSELVQHFTREWPISRWLVSDVTYGAWRAHHVSSELLAQLTPGGESPDTSEIVHATDRDQHSAPRIAAAIDAEAQGDTGVATALARASELRHRLAATDERLVLVLAPQEESEWGVGDRPFLYFLNHALRGTGSRLVLVSSPSRPLAVTDWAVRSATLHGDATKPQTSTALAALIPGILDADLWATLRDYESGDDIGTVTLANGFVLIPFDRRPKRSAVSRLRFDRLAVAVPPNDWRRAYAQFHGNNLYVDSALLAREAWRQFRAGGPDVGIRLLTRARSCARTAVEQAAFEAQMQGMRIATHDFDAAARIAEPRTDIPAPLRGFLLQTKGWGSVMCGRPDEAIPLLEQTSSLLNPESLDYLYLLNIRALAELRRGDWDRAHQLECAVASAHQAHAHREWQLHYVNMLNLARLYRRVGRWAEAADCYAEAFATSEGARSESELIYRNVCFAQLEERRGRYDAAFLAWLRACLHWVSAETPEAIGDRVVQSIAGKRVHWLARCDAVSEALTKSLGNAASRLSWLAPAAGNSADPSPANFARTDSVRVRGLTPDLWTAVGEVGWTVLTCDVPIEPAVDSAAHRRLRGWLRQLLHQCHPSAGLLSTATILVDDGLGSEMPVAFSEFRDSCVRLRVTHGQFGTTAVEWPYSTRTDFERRLHVRWNASVSTIAPSTDGGVVTFKRGRPPQPCSSEQFALLMAVADEPEISSLTERIGHHATVDVMDELRVLETRRWIHLFSTADDDACARLVSGSVRA
jgi:tetratricopeptide (TPR) repeat protein